MLLLAFRLYDFLGFHAAIDAFMLIRFRHFATRFLRFPPFFFHFLRRLLPDIAAAAATLSFAALCHCATPIFRGDFHCY